MTSKEKRETNLQTDKRENEKQSEKQTRNFDTI